MNNDIDEQNRMLDIFTSEHPQFKRYSDSAPSEVMNDQERLHEARNALRGVMSMCFPIKCPDAYSREKLMKIWNVSNIALARTSKAEAVDTEP